MCKQECGCDVRTKWRIFFVILMLIAAAGIGIHVWSLDSQLPIREITGHVTITTEAPEHHVAKGSTTDKKTDENPPKDVDNKGMLQSLAKTVTAPSREIVWLYGLQVLFWFGIVAMLLRAITILLREDG